jgi:uncharacterized protein (TIGR02145 family)
MKLVAVFAIICMFFITSCSDNSPCACPNDDLPNDTIKKDTFEIVKIGTQIWMSKNLEVTTFKNGDSIPQAKSEADWVYAKEYQKPVWCYYAFDENNGRKYGKLYNWYAVSDSRGLAPKGYHVPSDAEWTTLEDFLGGQDEAGEKLKSTTGWYADNGDNSSGFNGIPGGFCFVDGGFFSIGASGLWWSSSEHSADDA